VSGDYNRETGLVGNGSTKYLNSNRASNADPQNSFHMSIYRSSSGADKTLAGTVNTPFDLIDTYGTSGRFRVFLRSDTAVTSSASATNVSGFMGGSRTSSTAVNLRLSSATESFSGNTSSAPATNNIYIFARANVTTPQLLSDSRLAFYSIGESLTLSLLDSRVSTLLTAIAAAIP
jgi:hypothetical protein